MSLIIYPKGFLYILALRGGTRYCGITTNLQQRIKQHKSGMSKSTRHKLPLELCYVKEFENMSKARELEKMIKQQGVTRWYIKNVYILTLFSAQVI